MPKCGDKFVVDVLEIHMGWGEYPKRESPTRDEIINEGYIKIPKDVAVKLEIYNSNNEQANNEYAVETLNGCNIDGPLLAQGCSVQGDIYAKQFSTKGNLKEIGLWYKSVNAQPRGHVEVYFTSSHSLTLRYY